MKFRKCLVVIPTLNERDHIIDIIETMLADPAVHAVWVVDGGSTDGTRDCVTGFLPVSPRLRLIDNPGVTQAHAVNLAATMGAEQGFDALIRVDAHARYPRNFASGLLECLTRMEADSVVVPLLADRRAAAEGWRSAAADLQRSWLGHGGAAHRKAGTSCWTDHGHHAAFNLRRFVDLGGYDTGFAACEDVDYDWRLRQSGGRIWFAAGLPVAYLPRSRPGALLRQMIRNGLSRALWSRKHKVGLAARQLLPVLAVVTTILSLMAAVLFWAGFSLFAVSYLLLVLGLAMRARRGRSIVHGLRIGWLAMTCHIGFAVGLIRGFAARPRPGAT